MPSQDIYSVASGKAIYAGMLAPSSGGGSGGGAFPSISPGQFANIGTSTLLAAAPVGWPNSDIAGPFVNWSSGFYAKDFSSLGAFSVYGSGHLASADAPLWAGVWHFNLDTLAWEGSNVPAKPLVSGDGNIKFGDPGSLYNLYAESTITETLGHKYPPHTYDGLIYRPASLGGGAKGSLVQNYVNGSNLPKMVHQFDLSSKTNPPTRVIDNVTDLGESYSATAIDEARGGYWMMNYHGSVMTFIKFSDWSVTSFPNVNYNEYGDQSLVYIPAPWDCLVGMGRISSDVYAGSCLYVCPIVNNVPVGWTKLTPTGTPPADSRSGGQWFTTLQKIVSYNGDGSFTVHKLTPPAPANMTTGTWVWDSETLVGVNGATPSKGTSGVTNGSWGRFMEVPALKCALWCDSVFQPVQAWRLQGM